MDYKFEIKNSDVSDNYWLIIKREEKTDGFCMSLSELNQLKVIINNLIENERQD